MDECQMNCLVFLPFSCLSTLEIPESYFFNAEGVCMFLYLNYNQGFSCKINLYFLEREVLGRALWSGDCAGWQAVEAMERILV